MVNNESVVAILDGARGRLERIEIEQRRAKIEKGNGGEPPMDNHEMGERLASIEATLPHLATKAEMYIAIGAALMSAATGILTLIGAVIGLLKAFGHI